MQVLADLDLLAQFIATAWEVLGKLARLVMSVSDLMGIRIGATLKIVSRILLVELPDVGVLVSWTTSWTPRGGTCAR